MARLPREIKKAIKYATVILVLAVLVVNPTGSSFITAINSQEILLFHANDIVTNLNPEKEVQEDYYLATGTYEQQKDGELFGIARGRNLIVIQLEAMQNMLVNTDYYGQEITPVLNALIRDPGTVYFDNFYQQIGSGNTSDAEFAVNNSLIGTVESYTYQLFEDNYFRGMPWLLKERGYNTAVFHGFGDMEFWNRKNIYPILGFDRFYGGDDFEDDNIEGIGAGNITGISDQAFFRQTTAYMTQLPQPFYSFVITLSSHNPFGMPAELSEIKLRPSEDNIVGDYINAEHYADKCLGEFINELNSSGLYGNSIIAIYGDHFGLTKSDANIDKVVSNWLGHEYTYDEMLNIPLLINIPGMDINETLSVSGGQTDIMPTLAYLMGLETMDTIYLGQNLLTAEEGFVPMQTHLLKGSFIKDDVVFEMSRDGIFENSKAWNRLTREALPVDGMEDDYLRAKRTIEMSSFYLYNDVLRMALLEGKSFDDIVRVIEGKDQFDRNMNYRYVARGDTAAMESFYAYVNGSGMDKKIFLDSDDIVGLLEDMQALYSGKEGLPGNIKTVDEEINKTFQGMKTRVIPIDRRGDYTKIEYLGYDNIAFSPELEPELRSYSISQLNDFVAVNKPCAIILEPMDCFSESNGLMDGAAPVYVKGNVGAAMSALLKGMGAYGFVNDITLPTD